MAEIVIAYLFIESSPGRVDIARFVEASDEKLQRCWGVVRIDGESSQFRSLRILPLTKCLISLSDSGRVPRIARIEFLRSLKIGQGALPFTAAAVNRRAI